MSTDQAQSITICEEDVEAEVASVKGDSEKLCAYLKRPHKPAADVVRNLAHSLLTTAKNPGPGNWRLVFSTRNGRPPKYRRSPKCAAEALATGQPIPAAMYLLKNPEIDEATQHILANLLDAKGKSKWQLKFERARRGNPRSDLKTDIYQALMSHTSENLRAEAKTQRTESTNWERVIYPKAARELQKITPGIKASKSIIRAARAKAKRGKRQKNPPL